MKSNPRNAGKKLPCLRKSQRPKRSNPRSNPRNAGKKFNIIVTLKLFNRETPATRGRKGIFLLSTYVRESHPRHAGKKVICCRIEVFSYWSHPRNAGKKARSSRSSCHACKSHPRHAEKKVSA